MIIHVVKPNETIYTIARSYGVPPARIISDNELNDPNNLAVGQTLVILYHNQVHMVRQGESLYSIAEQYSVSVNQLLRNNPSLNGIPEIHEGQVIVIDYSSIKKGAMNVNGYVYPFVNHTILRKTLPYLTYLTIFAYTFDYDGNLGSINDNEVINIAREYGVGPLMLLATITERGTFDSDLAHTLLNDEAMQDRLINQILSVMRSKDYYGLDIDFEYVYADDRNEYTRFLNKIATRLHAEGYIVLVALAPKTRADQPGLLYEGHDYNTIGNIVDYSLLMTYEWGYSLGPPMAVSPIYEVRRVLDYGVTEIPSNRILMGVPNYGYDWNIPYVEGTKARSLGNVEAIEQAIEMLTSVEYDETSQAPFYHYTQDRQNHVVWFEDARSIDAKLNLVNEYNIAGISYWNLMKYFPQNWLVLNAQYNINKIQL